MSPALAEIHAQPRQPFCRNGFSALLPLPVPALALQSDSTGSGSLLERFTLVLGRSSWQDQGENRAVIRPKELLWEFQPRTLFFLFYFFSWPRYKS